MSPRGFSANSMEAYGTIDRLKRRNEILKAYKDAGRPMTDREIKDWLELDDMNNVRPRITELLQDGELTKSGDIIDTKTGKPVRQCVRPSKMIQADLF